MVGLEFTLNDGTLDYYDPVDIGNDFLENDEKYVFTLANNHTYILKKSDVRSLRIYELCETCGYELISHECSNNHCPTLTTL